MHKHEEGLEGEESTCAEQTMNLFSACSDFPDEVRSLECDSHLKQLADGGARGHRLS